MSNPNKPIELAIDDIKSEIVKTVNQLAEQYQIPGIMMSMILQQILDESKNISLSNYIHQMTITPEEFDTGVKNGDIPEIRVNASDFAEAARASVGNSDEFTPDVDIDQ